MAAFNDFPIDPCIALQIKTCILLKECKLKELRPKSKQSSQQLAGDGASTGVNAEIRLALNNAYACILEALLSAYTTAGEVFPPIPPLPDAIDFSNAAAIGLPTQARIDADPLAFLLSAVIIEFDENGTPTFIRCP